LENVNWSLQEVFYFPESFGTPKGTTQVKVRPQFEFQQNDGYCSLNGIYHISANVSFEPGVCDHHGTSEWVSIEDLEMNGESGYFEYAVPLSIELPPDYKHGNISPELSINDIQPFVTNEKALQIKWNVVCAYEKVIKVESLPEESSSSSSSSSSEAIVEAVDSQEFVQPFFLKDLKESYSVYQVK
jgi:hypothetical protein